MALPCFHGFGELEIPQPKSRNELLWRPIGRFLRTERRSHSRLGVREQKRARGERTSGAIAVGLGLALVRKRGGDNGGERTRKKVRGEREEREER